MLDQNRDVTVSGYTLRLLPMEEWPRLAEANGPLSGHVLPQEDTARIIVAENAAGQIVAYWVASATVHLDPCWFDPEVRQRAKFTTAFLGLMVHTLQAAGVRYAYAIIGDADQPGNGQLAESLGLSKVNGSLYGGYIPPAES